MKPSVYSVLASAKSTELTSKKEIPLAESTKEVPLSSKKHELKDEISIDYAWSNSSSKLIKVKNIVFSKDEDLSTFYSLSVVEGSDTVSFIHNNAVYVLRQVEREIMKEVYSLAKNISSLTEKIVGHMKSVLGFDYLISKLPESGTTFDQKLAKRSILYIDPKKFPISSLSNLCELIAQKVANLHSLNYILGRFGLGNLLLSKDDLLLVDLRKIRLSRKRTLVIDEFIDIFRYLMRIGFAENEDVYSAVAYYSSMNELVCREWFKEKYGSKNPDSFEIAKRLEEEIYK